MRSPARGDHDGFLSRAIVLNQMCEQDCMNPDRSESTNRLWTSTGLYFQGYANAMQLGREQSPHWQGICLRS